MSKAAEYRQLAGDCIAWARLAKQLNELASSHVEHGLPSGSRRARLPQAQDAPEAPPGPWGRPESF
jgi:hypothetical protein